MCLYIARLISVQTMKFKSLIFQFSTLRIHFTKTDFTYLFINYCCFYDYYYYYYYYYYYFKQAVKHYKCMYNNFSKFDVKKSDVTGNFAYKIFKCKSVRIFVLLNISFCLLMIL